MVDWSALTLCQEVVCSQHWDCIYASEKAAQGWVWSVSASRRLWAILGRSQGLLRCVDVEGVAWEMMWKHNKSEFQRGLIYLLGTCISTKQLLVGFGITSQVLWICLSHRIVSEPSDSSNSLPVLRFLIVYFTPSASHHRILPITPHSVYNTTTPITTHYNT